MLRSEAPYSFDTDRSSGTGGGACHRIGFNLRYHFGFCAVDFRLNAGGLASSADADLALEAAWSFSLSATTICGNGSGGAAIRVMIE